MNLVVGCAVYKWVMTSCKASGHWGQNTKISAMDLFHELGCKVYECTYHLSNLVMKRLAYEGANIVPMPMPNTWW